MASREEAVTELLQPIIEDMGYIWWGVEYHHNSVNAILRVYVDKEGGVSIDDIVAVTEQLNPVLDVESPIANAYTFEVSSPGMDRQLFTLPQYKMYIGEDIKCVVKNPIEGRRRFQGQLMAVDMEKQSVIIALEKMQTVIQFDLLFDEIEKANIVPKFKGE